MNRAGEWLNLVLTLAFFGTVFWLAWRQKRSKRKSESAPDDPDQPYTVFTREFDLELRGAELERRLIGASPDYQSGWLKLGKDRWRQEIHLADKLVEEHRASFNAALGPVPELRNCAVTILIDQSGSMDGDPMRWAAVASRLAAEALDSLGATVEVLGFSTAGWRGGFAYQKWQSSGRPKRPGRLCALLHVIYKAKDEETLDRANWETMLNPNTLRENVDGEALAWAAARMMSARGANKQLIVLSDGAPVDDATYFHNGGGYLVRHLQRVISDIEADRSIQLSAIGIRHPVERYYGRSVGVEDLTQLPEVLAKWLALSAQTEVH